MDKPQRHMSEKSTKTLSNDFESRKIIKSWLGISLACIHTFVFAVCFGLGIVFISQAPLTGTRTLDPAEGFICWTIGMVPKIVEGHGRNYSMMVFSCYSYLLACLLQMYMPLRALVQPRFLAGKPNINSFWPLVLALILRITTEITYTVSLGSTIVPHVILVILLNAAYSYALYEIYSVDDDNLPLTADGKAVTNFKPWQFEVKNTLPKYSDPKK